MVVPCQRPPDLDGFLSRLGCDVPRLPAGWLRGFYAWLLVLSKRKRIEAENYFSDITQGGNYSVQRFADLKMQTQGDEKGALRVPNEQGFILVLSDDRLSDVLLDLNFRVALQQ